MRYPPEHKEATRRRILAAAAALFRRDGVEATGLPAVMREAGLTVGGFYRHFDSKAALFREALAASLERTLAFLRRGPAREDGAAWLREAAARYLSREHLENVEHGCPLPSLTPEVARADPEVRTAYARALSEIVEEIERRMPEEGSATPRDRAWGFVATTVGGLMLARGVEDPELAEEILRGCRRAAAPGDGPAATRTPG